MTLSRKDASNIFVKKLFDLRKQLLDVFFSYESFDAKIAQLTIECQSLLQVEAAAASKKKKMLKNARNIHPPPGHHNPTQRANKPKLKKQRSIDLNDADIDNPCKVGTGANHGPAVIPSAKEKGMVKHLIEKFEKNCKKAAIFIKDKKDKTRDRIIGKRKSKLSTLRKENKNRSIKQVNAFLNDTYHNPVVLVSVNNMFDTSHLDANVLIKHGYGSCGGGSTPSAKKTTPKFVRFNETNTLKPYGSESTASTFAELCSSVMMSSNSIKTFKTANSTFDSTLRTPTHMTSACAGNTIRFEEFDHPPSFHGSIQKSQPYKCTNMTVTINKKPSSSSNSKRVTYCRLPQIAPRVKVTTSDDEEYDEDESGSGDEDFIDAPKQQTQHLRRAPTSESDSPNRLTLVSSTTTTTTTATTTASTVVKKRSSSASSRGRSKYDQSNYSIDELRADDETDDEEEPRKPIPKWAQSDVLARTSRQQAHKAINFQQLFRASAQVVLLEKVFPIVKNNFHVRSSSAEWPSPAIWRSNTLTSGILN